jgi:hypothetical protein
MEEFDRDGGEVMPALAIIDLSWSAKADHPVNALASGDYWIIRFRG